MMKENKDKVKQCEMKALKSMFRKFKPWVVLDEGGKEWSLQGKSIESIIKQSKRFSWITQPIKAKETTISELEEWQQDEIFENAFSLLKSIIRKNTDVETRRKYASHMVRGWTTYGTGVEFIFGQAWEKGAYGKEHNASPSVAFISLGGSTSQTKNQEYEEEKIELWKSQISQVLKSLDLVYILEGDQFSIKKEDMLKIVFDDGAEHDATDDLPSHEEQARDYNPEPSEIM